MKSPAFIFNASGHLPSNSSKLYILSTGPAYGYRFATPSVLARYAQNLLRRLDHRLRGV